MLKDRDREREREGGLEIENQIITRVSKYDSSSICRY